MWAFESKREGSSDPLALVQCLDGTRPQVSGESGEKRAWPARSRCCSVNVLVHDPGTPATSLPCLLAWGLSVNGC